MNNDNDDDSCRPGDSSEGSDVDDDDGDDGDDGDAGAAAVSEGENKEEVGVDISVLGNEAIAAATEVNKKPAKEDNKRSG